MGLANSSPFDVIALSWLVVFLSLCEVHGSVTLTTSCSALCDSLSSANSCIVYTETHTNQCTNTSFANCTTIQAETPSDNGPVASITGVQCLTLGAQFTLDVRSVGDNETFSRDEIVAPLTSIEDLNLPTTVESMSFINLHTTSTFAILKQSSITAPGLRNLSFSGTYADCSNYSSNVPAFVLKLEALDTMEYTIGLCGFPENLRFVRTLKHLKIQNPVMRGTIETDFYSFLDKLQSFSISNYQPVEQCDADKISHVSLHGYRLCVSKFVKLLVESCPLDLSTTSNASNSRVEACLLYAGAAAPFCAKFLENQVMGPCVSTLDGVFRTVSFPKSTDLELSWDSKTQNENSIMSPITRNTGVIFSESVESLKITNSMEDGESILSLPSSFSGPNLNSIELRNFSFHRYPQFLDNVPSLKKLHLFSMGITLSDLKGSLYSSLTELTLHDLSVGKEEYFFDTDLAFLERLEYLKVSEYTTPETCPTQSDLRRVGSTGYQICVFSPTEEPSTENPRSSIGNLNPLLFILPIGLCLILAIGLAIVVTRCKQTQRDSQQLGPTTTHPPSSEPTVLIVKTKLAPLRMQSTEDSNLNETQCSPSVTDHVPVHTPTTKPQDSQSPTQALL